MERSTLAPAGRPGGVPGTLAARASPLAASAPVRVRSISITHRRLRVCAAISGGGAVNVLAGTTILTGANTYSTTNVDAARCGRCAEHVQLEFGNNRRHGETLDLNGSVNPRPPRNGGLVNMGTGTPPGTAFFVTIHGTGGTIR